MAHRPREDRPGRARAADSGSVPKELGGGVEQAEARSLRPGRGWLRQVWEALAQLGDDLREIRGAGSELRAQRGGIALAHVGAQRLHPGPVGGGTARLPAAADQDPRAAGSRLCDQLLGEAALADARLADEQEQAPAAGEGIIETGRRARQARARGRRTRRGGVSPAGCAPARLAGRELESRVLRGGSPGGARAGARPGSIPSSSTRRAARRLVGRERLGLAAAAVEREHQLPAQALAQRVLLTSPSSSPTSSAWRPRARSASMRSSSAARRASSRRAISALGERLVGEVGERRAAPQTRAPGAAARPPAAAHAAQPQTAPGGHDHQESR